ncbi:hypothetical protein [Bacillus cereus]|uniref:hypothetical protein n=1 Tax=Bacillus cereus TaxID=1396 RepID=UPI0035CD1D4D
MYFNNSLPPNSYYGHVSLDYNRQDSCGSSPPSYMIRSREYLNENPSIKEDIVKRIRNGEIVPFPCAPGDGDCPGSFVMRDVPTATLAQKKLTWALFLTGPGVSGPFKADIFFIFQVPESNPNRTYVTGYLAPNTTIPVSIDSQNIWAVL